MPGRSGALIFAALLAITAVPAGAAEFLGAFEWERDAAEHGGFSGLELSDDGSRFTALSDRSRIVTGTLLREGGRIKGVTVETDTALRNLRGNPLRGDFGDSEGLVVTPDGLFVAFESTARVWRYATPDAIPEPLPRHPDFSLLPNNGALEALAIDGDGVLYTLPERNVGSLPFPVWRYDGSWSLAFSLAEQGYAIVGADFDDAGRLYLLERRFRGIGFASRLRRVTLEAGQPVADDVLLSTALRQHDNLEGLSIWRNADGRLIATMISDDNFNWFQRTEIVEYALPD